MIIPKKLLSVSLFIACMRLVVHNNYNYSYTVHYIQNLYLIDDIRRRLGMPTKSTSPVKDHSVPLKPRSSVSLSFTEGKRLGKYMY